MYPALEINLRLGCPGALGIELAGECLWGMIVELNDNFDAFLLYS